MEDQSDFSRKIAWRQDLSTEHYALMLYTGEWKHIFDVFFELRFQIVFLFFKMFPFMQRYLSDTETPVILFEAQIMFFLN